VIVSKGKSNNSNRSDSSEWRKIKSPFLSAYEPVCYNKPSYIFIWWCYVISCHVMPCWFCWQRRQRRTHA